MEPDFRPEKPRLTRLDFFLGYILPTVLLFVVGFLFAALVAVCIFGGCCGPGPDLV